jgi:hypothetical protein
MDLRVPRRTFLDVLDNGEAVWQQSQGTDRARLKTVAEDTFLRFIVGWESFVSDWFIGCVNRDASRLRKHVQDQLKRWHQEAVKAAPYDRYHVCRGDVGLCADDGATPVGQTSRRDSSRSSSCSTRRMTSPEIWRVLRRPTNASRWASKISCIMRW